MRHEELLALTNSLLLTKPSRTGTLVEKNTNSSWHIFQWRVKDSKNHENWWKMVLVCPKTSSQNWLLIFFGCFCHPKTSPSAAFGLNLRIPQAAPFKGNHKGTSQWQFPVRVGVLEVVFCPLDSHDFSHLQTRDISWSGNRTSCPRDPRCSKSARKTWCWYLYLTNTTPKRSPTRNKTSQNLGPKGVKISKFQLQLRSLKQGETKKCCTCHTQGNLTPWSSKTAEWWGNHKQSARINSLHLWVRLRH